MTTTRSRLAALIAAQHDVGTASLDLQAVMDVVTQRAQELTEAHGAVLELVDDDELVYQAATGSARDSVGLRVAIAASLSGLAVRSGQAQRCDDAEEDPRVDRDACRRVGLRSMIVVPLEHGAEIQGVLKVLSATPAAFDDEDVDTLELIAGLMAAAISRANRFAVQEAHSAALRDAGAVKDAFLAAASHDLRGPLAGIEGFANLLEARADLLAPTKVRAYAQHILVSCRQLQRVVGNVLDVERLSEGQVELLRSATPLHELVSQVVATHNTFGQRTIVTELPAVTVDVDAGLIERIVDNLVGNALKHTPTGATVWVRLEPGAEAVRLLIEDDGRGVPAADRKRIFEAFQRGAAGSNLNSGTGIGLYVAARFAALHGGRISVGDRAGGGASFRVDLPAGGGTSRAGGA